MGHLHEQKQKDCPHRDLCGVGVELGFMEHSLRVALRGKVCEVKLARECPIGVKVCAKCEQSNMVRDKVKGGQSLAQSMAASWDL